MYMNIHLIGFIRELWYLAKSKTLASNGRITRKALLCTCIMTCAFWSDFFAIAACTTKAKNFLMGSFP